jgi:tetratricopeptide (TPR) repeat protein
VIPLRRAAELDPLDAEIRQDLAQAVGASPLSGPQRAVEIRLEAAELNPLDGGNLMGLAELYAALDQEQSALAAAKRAVEVQPNEPRAYVVLGRLQERMDREEKALDTWRALDELWESPVGQNQAIATPTDFDWAYAWLALAQQAERQGDLNEAGRFYRQAADLTGQFASARRKNEELLRQIGTWDETEVREAERLTAKAERGLERVGEDDAA